MIPSVIGIDLGGTKMIGGLVSFDGQIHSTQQVATPRGAEAVLASLIELCRELLHTARTSGLDVTAVGIGTAGQVDVTNGVITYANENLKDWTGVPLARHLHEAVRLPVYVDNDVNVLALGEGRFGAGRDYRNLLYITVGTGVGGALVFNGQLWRGANFSAGEVGYLVADRKPVTLEAVASGPAMAKRYSPESPPLQAVVERANAGDELAVEVIRNGAEILGEVLGGLVCVIDPEILIVGGGVSNIGALWWTPFETTLRNSPLPARKNIRVAKAAFESGIIGAACLAMQKG